VIARLREALSRGKAPASPLRLVVRGRSGAGRRTLISALAETANRTVAMLDAAPLVRDGRVRAEDIAVRVQRAALGGWLPCVDNLDAIGHDDRGAREQLREIFRTHPGPLVLRLGSDVTPPLDPGYAAIDLPPLAETRRLEAWNTALAERGLALPDVEELASRWVLGPGTVNRVLDQLIERGATGEAAEALGRLDGLIRQHLESRLGDLANRLPRLASWSQIVLPPDVLDSLLELVSRIRHRRTVFERWGYDRVMSTSRGITALFQGGPGTGKTMVASAIARELGLDVYRVDLARVVSKWIGETERNLAQLFDAAEDGQAMILFDEADSLFAKRTEVKTSVDRYANLEVNYLLQRLDSFGGIAILTTNFGGAIDTAFKRRLSFRLSFPFPDDEMREQLWRVHLPPEVPRSGELDLADLARKYKMSGGYIRNAALRAAFLAAAEESGLRHDHLERAVRLEYREIGKLAETGALE
jgi:AAA+ superfamily predicted ATPase